MTIYPPAVGRCRRLSWLPAEQVKKHSAQVTCVDKTRLLSSVCTSTCIHKSHLLENSLEFLKALSLHGPGANEKEDGKSGRVEDVDAPGVEEEDVPEVREARAAENAHKPLKKERLSWIMLEVLCTYLSDPLSDKDFASIRKNFPQVF